MRIKLSVLFILIGWMSLAQEINTNSYFDINYFKGNIALHNNDILHLIKGHPEGLIFSWNKKTFGENAWEQRYNYPDYGVSFTYQNLKNDVLGNNYALYGHYNIYFLKRNLMLRIAQGLAFTSNPYHRVNNHKNIAFGSKFIPLEIGITSKETKNLHTILPVGDYKVKLNQDESWVLFNSNLLSKKNQIILPNASIENIVKSNVSVSFKIQMMLDSFETGYIPNMQELAVLFDISRRTLEISII